MSAGTGSAAAEVETGATESAESLAHTGGATADPDPEHATTEDISEEHVRRSRRWFQVAATVPAVLAVAFVGLTAWLFFQSRTDQLTGPVAVQEALNAAKDGAVAVLSYSPDSVDRDIDAAKTHLTGDFLSYYTKFTDEVVRSAAKEKAVDAKATIVRGAISEMQPERAKALLFANQVTTSNTRQEPSAMSSSVVVTLTKVNGSWLISAFDPV
ncbi:hypothetical protein A5761_09850 [Mycolicibacterium setense]|nr:hypothetical protein A5761_09850 [Mycolicibacterium setense]